MKKIYKEILFLIVIFIAVLCTFNVVYDCFGYDYFSKAVSTQGVTSFTRDGKIKIGKEKSFKIENKDYNNASFYKKISVKQNTPYKISCMVKTKNVESLSKASSSGAKITLLGEKSQSNVLVGNNDWTKLELMVNSMNKTELSIGFMLGGDLDVGDVKGEAWFTNLQISEGELDSNNEWNFVCFVFKNTNVTIDEAKYSYSLSSKDLKQINNCMERFKKDCKVFSNEKMEVNYKIIEIEEPITKMSSDLENGYYIDGDDISNIIDSYLGEEDYDHIFVCARLTNESSSIPIEDWLGLGGMTYKGIGYSNIRMPSSASSFEFVYNESINQFPEEVFVHEFAHTLERLNSECGFETPSLHNNVKYGFDDQERIGLYRWYKDYMQCDVDSVNGKIGINEIVYKMKPLNKTNFQNEIVLNEFKGPRNIIEKISAMFSTIFG